MPVKTCPECGKQWGPRKKECDKCGHSFVTKKVVTNAVIPEPGTWVLDKTKGMPDICPPENLPPGMLDLETIKDSVMYEGLGYCIFEYIPSERIQDRVLKKRWIEAREAMSKVWEYIYDV